MPQGRLKLRDFSDGHGELIRYQRPDASGPKISDYSISRTEDPDGLGKLLAAALQRYFFGNLSALHSIVLFAGSLCLIYPDWRSTAAGFVIAGAIMFLQKARSRNMPVPANTQN